MTLALPPSPPPPAPSVPLSISGGPGLVWSPPNTSNYPDAARFPSITLSFRREVLAHPSRQPITCCLLLESPALQM